MKIIEHGIEGWQPLAEEEIDLVDRFYQLFNGDVKEDPFVSHTFYTAIEHYVELSKKRAELLRGMKNYEGADVLLQNAECLVQKYDVPIPVR